MSVASYEELPYGKGLEDGMICHIENEQRDVVWCERWQRWIYMDGGEEGPRIFGRPR